ncbi:respiratory nitrate reductase subunit gamma [Tuberibacillus calidus]|jgi:nitrate reductase gamma subunit|uniref:respiratory nitrate reductase subunit gamma n=1 Tax=Tuberibacillus calidus TaxID=340097 RepID=UPI0003FDF581|nr:respiratory nitrate reductase subunit gamma [Tuberibacillus calidus]
MLNQFFWVILPYLVMVIFIGGHLYRFHYNQLGWTAKSSEFLEKNGLKWGSRMFHWGIIMVFFGHVAGLLVPVQVYRSLGISDHLYHMAAVWGGGAAGILTCAGILTLLLRRVSSTRVRKTSRISDFLAVFFLAAVIIFGLMATFTNAASATEFDYRETINPWVRGILSFHPNADYMKDVPLPFKIHILATMALGAIWPFTRLVHVFSLPLSYLNRSYVLYRKRTNRRVQYGSKKF